MTENILRQLQEQDLLLLALRAIDDYMELSKGSNLAAIEQKRDELSLINKIIKEKRQEVPQEKTSNA